MLWLLAGLFALYSVWWLVLADRIEDGIAAWASARRAEGYEVAYESLSVTGFPYRVEVTIRHPALGRPENPVPWRWQGETLVGNVLPYDLDHIVLRARGPHHIAYGRERLELVPETARASIVFADEALDRLSAEMTEVTAAGSAPSARIGLVQLHARRAPGGPPGEAEIALRVEHLRAPALTGTPLGDAVDLLVAQAHLDGAAERAHRAGLDAALVAWQPETAGMAIDNLVLDWGPLRVEAAGQLALDAAHRPSGELATRIRGHDRLIDALVASGEMAANDARYAKAALDTLAQAQARASARDGSGPPIALPLRLRAGRAYLGPVRIARLGPLF